MKRIRKSAMRLAALVFLGAGSVGAVAQQAACHTAERSEQAVAPEHLPVPVRMTGIGNGHIAITSSSDEAKVWFDQGLNLLHDFWDYESARAFEQSVRLDPKCAMCWWGLARAESFRGERQEGADAALKQAVLLAKDKRHTTEAERLYIKADRIKAEQEGAKEQEAKKANAAKAKAAEAKNLADTKAVGTAGTDGAAGVNGAAGAKAADGKGAPVKVAAHKDSKETKVWRRLVAFEPEEIQPKIFLAESLMDGFDKDGKPHAGTVQGQAVLEALLVAHPEDSAVNHYWIHAMEPSLHPERALPSARILGSLAGSSGHMVHMPGHIFYRTGDYETARLSFENSMGVDEGYMKGQKVRVEDDWNYVHNMMYLIADLLEAGRIGEATAVSAKLNAAHGTYGSSLYLRNARDQVTRLGQELPVALRSGDWTAATKMLEASRPPAEWVNLVELRGALLEYVQGMAAIEAKEVAGAAKWSATLDARLKAGTAGTSGKDGGMPAGMPGMANPAARPAANSAANSALRPPSKKDAAAETVKSYVGVAALELRAAVELAQGKTDASAVTFMKAAAAERELGYREPPFYIRPVGETRGDALMRATRFKEAKAAYEAALGERPNSGYPLYGIGQADAAAGDVAGARMAYAAMLKAWDKADAGLPQMIAAKAWLTEHGAVVGQ